MSQKDFCIGVGSVPVEVRLYDGIASRDSLGQCGTCGRILKVTPNGRLRQHSVRGKNTASHDRTMEILWAGAGARGAAHHFAVGLPVYVRKGATPAGWPDHDDFGDYWEGDDYLRTFQIQSVHDDETHRSTYEVMGWYWYPEDLVAG